MQPNTEHGQEIAWLRGARLISSIDALNAPEDQKTWLHLTTSVTKKLQQTFQTKPGLRLLDERVENGNPWERELLLTKQDVFARHIALTIEEEPIVLARSVTTLGRGMDTLTKLNTRPLAELLFEEPQWKRQSVTRYLALQGGAQGRGCVWHNRDSGIVLIVQEFFLDSLFTKIRSAV
ncbi:MAG: chorismate lyase [Pseudomonadota bacterium]|nr:chorismate lyase [Pseudomonadota bacterium]